MLSTLRRKAGNQVFRFRSLFGYRFQPRTITWRGLKIETGRHMAIWVIDALRRGTYEEGECAIVERFLRPDDVVFEVGTGLGAMALFCSRVVGADRVHTFEANPAMAPHIRRNFELNRLHPESQTCLLGRGEGEVDFYPGPSFEVSSAFDPGDGRQALRTPIRDLNAELRRVDPTFLIVDIEGGEAEFFETLEHWGRIDQVAMEVHPQIIGEAKVARVRERLEEAGFVIDPEHTKGLQLFARRDRA